MGVCLALPAVSLPTIALGLSLDPPPLSIPAYDARLCCKIPLTPAIPLIPDLGVIPIGGTLLSGIDNVLDAIDAYLDALPLDCPKEFK